MIGRLGSVCVSGLNSREAAVRNHPGEGVLAISSAFVDFAMSVVGLLNLPRMLPRYALTA